MNTLNKHKAAIITFLLIGSFVLGLFSIQLKLQNELITESYYEIEPEPELTPEDINEQHSKDQLNPSSNKAFNEDQEYKEMMRNFKTVSANDFERTTKALEQERTETTDEELQESELGSNSKDYALNADETSTFKKLQKQLEKRRNGQKEMDEHVNARSSLTYSLKDRVLEFYKTPRYLCEYGGKIVISIKVDSEGNVFETSVNGASNSANQCLIESALDYAKSTRFDASESATQIGTITFMFKGKS